VQESESQALLNENIDLESYENFWDTNTSSKFGQNWVHNITLERF
jgi:hypothetical protein